MNQSDVPLSSIFGDDVGIDSTVVVQTRSLGFPIFGQVTHVSSSTMTMKGTRMFQRERASADCVLKLAGGVHAGFHRGCRNFGAMPISWQFLDRRAMDPFFASANFVIRAPISESVDGACQWRSMLVHGWVAYQRWSYFRRVIDAGMHESSTNILSLPAGFSPDLLHALVWFLYTKRTPPSFVVTKGSDLEKFIVEYGAMFGFGRDELEKFNPCPMRRVSGAGSDFRLGTSSMVNFTGLRLTGRPARTARYRGALMGSGVPFPDYSDDDSV